MALLAQVQLEEEEFSWIDLPETEHSVGDELAIDSEYGSKNTYNQTQKVVEDGNGLGNDPCDHPQGERNANPGSNSKNALLVHVVRATENANIDVFAGNVAVDNTSNDDL
ncbi:unnamed protein product [Aspergillus oryzae var. brunneus]|uniref:Unnamed protein product n=2 Tax=Aspergillus oryzae TaxID=5062 RepID=A0AAN5BTC7_ASPOZ|nr:unnamed protein product [Aspergillus oryzae]GMG24723.1 unnamed protein product [Aspergillus oryzae]GMG50360.1 unnamed protein product [Aspergillus oryzae var. brunneus]